MNTKVLSLCLLLAIPARSYGVCVYERDRYQEANSRCENLSSLSAVTGHTGLFFFCAGLCAAAHNACNIRDVRRTQLQACQAHHLAEVRRMEAQSRADYEAQQAKINRINQIDAEYVTKKAEVDQKYARKYRKFQQDYVADGWDPECDEGKAYLKAEYKRLEKERKQVIQRLEYDRRYLVTYL